MIKKNKPKLILLILLLAIFLRLWKLDEVPVSLFGDELDVGYHAYSILKTGKDYSGNPWPLHFQSLAEFRTPLYLYSVVPTVALFGISPLGVRLPAVVFGLLGVWGMYLLVGEIVRDKKLSLFNARLTMGEIAALVLAISPWHIQYSRAGFEVTMLLAFVIFGLYFFFKSLKKGKYLRLSAVLIILTPLIYSTAKLFSPLLMIFLFFVWRKDLLKISKKYLMRAVFAGFIVGLPVVYATLFSGGSQRFGYISVFSDPTREAQIGYEREFDAKVRGPIGLGLQPTFTDKLFHNKIVFWKNKILRNYLQPLSSEFLFTDGDPNLRHSIEGVGQFYMIEMVAMILGLILFFSSRLQDRKVKALIAFWVLGGILPAAITRDGGNHATRLILILPPLIFLIAYGMAALAEKMPGLSKPFFLTSYFLALTVCFIFYQHNYWIHNPWYSERWWHSGWCEAIQSIKNIDEKYDRVIISMEGEPAWIFFAGCYEYSPEKWHAEFPLGNDEYVEGFGKISHIDKYYFGSPRDESGGFYALPDYIDENTLYLANANEVGTNLIMEPDRKPAGLTLMKSIAFPSGEPAFYLFSGQVK